MADVRIEAFEGREMISKRPESRRPSARRHRTFVARIARIGRHKEQIPRRRAATLFFYYRMYVTEDVDITAMVLSVRGPS
jgi:hypothetical protein